MAYNQSRDNEYTKVKDVTTGDPTPLQGTGGAAHVYGLARNLEIAGVGTTAIEFFGFICSIVPGADVQITPVGGGAVTTIDAGSFTAGQVYPIHGTSVTITTSGEFLLFTADD